MEMQTQPSSTYRWGLFYFDQGGAAHMWGWYKSRKVAEDVARHWTAAHAVARYQRGKAPR